MDSVGTLGTWLRVEVVDVMKSFTSSVPFMVNKRSFLPTQFDDGDLKTAIQHSMFQRVKSWSLSSEH